MNGSVYRMVWLTKREKIYWSIHTTHRNTPGSDQQLQTAGVILTLLWDNPDLATVSNSQMDGQGKRASRHDPCPVVYVTISPALAVEIPGTDQRGEKHRKQ